MSKQSEPSGASEAPELIITRIFDAPRELVFKAWSEPERLLHWWGPKGLNMGVSRFEFQPGGTFLYSMETPDGHKMWGKFVYREIEAPARIVFAVSFTDEAGNPVRHPLSPTWPLEVLNELILEEEANGKTKLTLRGGPINATAEECSTYEAGIPSMHEGFGGTMDQLDAYLAEAGKA
jgi:uncharacterized protein YndB with AHSA1/START domain